MGHWGVASYENDEAADALDAGFERVHGAVYESLMEDDNPLSFEEVQQQLADPRTLEAALRHLIDQAGPEYTDWEEELRLAMVGVVVRHAELGVRIPEDWRHRALEWLEDEPLDWPQDTLRKLRRQKESQLLKSTTTSPADGEPSP